MSRARLGLGLALLAALGACKSVGPNFTPPAAPTESGYLMPGDAPSQVAELTPDARAAGAWWKALGSADLDRVMDQALAGNPTIAAANASLERMRQLAIAQSGMQLPQVDANGNLTGERINLTALGVNAFPGFNISNPTLGLYSIGGNVSYDADLFGGLRRATEAARARAENQARQADAAYLTLTGQTAIAAIHIATVRASLAQAEAAVSDDQRLIDMVNKATVAGGEAPSATDKLKAQLAQDQSAIPPIRLELAQARHALAELVGQAPADWTAPDFDLAGFSSPTAIPVSLPSTLVRQRPDILAAEANLHEATAQIGVATAQMYPDIRLTANIAQTALFPGNLLTYNASGWTLAAGLTQPLSHGGTLKANQRAAVAGARAAFDQYRGTVIAAFTQVADVLQAVDQDQAEIDARTHAVETAEAALRDDEAAYRLGGGPLFPVIDDERQLQIARQARVIAEGRRLADIAQLFVATAADWRETKS